MPKLSAERQKGVDSQEKGEFKPLKPGRYVYKLTEVEEGVTGEKSKDPGTDKWVWKLSLDKDYHPEYRKGRWQSSLQIHIPLTEAMDWKTSAMYEGFGYTPDSDTDEIIEDEEARIVVYVGTGKDIVTGEDRTEAKRFLQFDPSRFTKVPYDDPDDDDNQ